MTAWAYVYLGSLGVVTRCVAVVERPAMSVGVEITAPRITFRVAYRWQARITCHAFRIEVVVVVL